MSEIDFHRAVIMANEMLVRAGIKSYPFDPIPVVKLIPNCVCRKYATARKWGVNIESFGSESAIIVEMEGKNIIFYDESKPQCHINFSILHELGHLVLKHPLNCKNLSPASYHRYEVEANYFAAQMLMPMSLIAALRCRQLTIIQHFLVQHFGVSSDAATKRLNTMRNMSNISLAHSEREYDDIIVSLANSFMESIRPSYSFFDYAYEEDMQRRRESWM